MEIPGTGHGRNMVGNFLQDTHFGHPSPRPYMPIGGSPPIGVQAQHVSWGGGTTPWGGVGGGAELEWRVIV